MRHSASGCRRQGGPGDDHEIRVFARLEAADAIAETERDGSSQRGHGEELVGRHFGLFGRGADVAGGSGHAALGKELFGLVFVEIQSDFRFEI